MTENEIKREGMREAELKTTKQAAEGVYSRAPQILHNWGHIRLVGSRVSTDNLFEDHDSS